MRVVTSPGTLALILGNESYKGLLILWSHRVTLVPEIAVVAATYLMLQFLLGGGRLVAALLPVTLLGFLAYALIYLVTLRVSAGILEEMNAGTLEQVHLSPLPAWLLSAGRLGAGLAEGIGITALLAVGAVALLGISYPLRWEALLPIALTVLDIAGFALLIGGITLVFTGIGTLLHIIHGIVMLLNGSLVPVALFPEWLGTIARLLPTTLGIEATRKLLLDGLSLDAVWSDGTLPLLLAHTAATLAFGWVVYEWATQRALRDGRLGPR